MVFSAAVCALSWFPTIIASLVVVHFVDVFLKNGAAGLFKSIANAILLLPGMGAVVKSFTKKEIVCFMEKSFTGDKKTQGQLIPIPEKGVSIDELQQQLTELKDGNKDLSEEGRLFAYVYTSHGPRFQLQIEAFKMFSDLSLELENEAHVSIVKSYLETFMHDNALNPLVFPALRKFENEVVSMTASMLHGDAAVVGSVTSGGTESILMAMKTYRDMARALRPSVKNPNVIAPATIHPAFEKAAHYFNIKIKHVPVSQTTFTPDMNRYESEIDSDTILL
uniref:Sphingosine-1-phosphate lyase n=1 Tax=Ciona savignyi TaxID=51511 RepID=H2Z2C0_CIOSA